MMVNNTLLAAATAAAAIASAASAFAAPALHLGLPPPAMERHEHDADGSMARSRNAMRQQQYGYYGGLYGSYGYGPPPSYPAPLAAEPAAPPVVAAAAPAYNSEKVCPVVWRWSARAGQPVRTWSYCNN
jgi:hypothetical protein